MKEMKEHPFSKFRYCPKCGSDRFEVNDEKSKRCGACGFVYYFNPAAATVAFIINDKDELLVCRRAAEPAKGTLDLPGGFVDMGETAEEGVAREVMEETGLTVNAVEYCFSIPNIYRFSDFDVHTVDMFFACRVMSAERPQAHDDAAEAFFVPLSEVDPEEFGLNSISRGVKRLLSVHQPYDK